MKKFALLIMALSLAGTAWAQQAGLTPALPIHPTSGAPHPGTPTTAANPITITPEEWQELRADRNAAFQANPELVAENRKLSERMRALEDKINVAMVKADPTIGPIMAKLKANAPHPLAPAGSPSAPPPPAK